MPRNSDDNSNNDVGIVKVAVAVVLSDGMVLVGKRSADADLGGFDEFPGGKVEVNESPEAAAIRECREETGLLVRVARLLNQVQHAYEHATVKIDFFLCECDRPAAPLEPYRWVSLQELSDHRFPPANETVLARLQDVFAD